MRNLIAFSGATVAPSLFFVGYVLFASSLSNGTLKLNEIYVLAVVALCVSAGHVLLLGVPTFLVLTRFKPISLSVCICGGFLLATIPVMFYAWPYKVAIDYMTFSSGGNVLVDQGQLTGYAWLSWLQGIVTMGVFGAIGGYAFWAIYKRLS